MNRETTVDSMSAATHDTMPFHGYRSAAIYFWSGTGNSYRAATWIAEDLANDGAEASVIPLAQADPGEEIGNGPENLAGLAFPAHGFTAPWRVIRFGLRLPSRKGTHALIVVTRAGIKVGPVCLPGMEGTAGYLLALILALKGYSVRGVTGLDMPSSWLALHWGLSTKNARVIIDRARKKLSRFTGQILAHGRCFWSFIDLALGLVFLPVSVLYILVGRFTLAKLFFANSQCTGCGLCAERCPEGAIHMLGKHRKMPYWTFSCESCMRCMAFCPERAVEASHSFCVVLYYVTGIPVSLYILHGLAGRFPWITALDNRVARFVVFDYPYILVSIFLLYAVLNAAVRIPLINKFFTYTTLTHIYRRYNEPETRAGDLMKKHVHSRGIKEYGESQS
ncbi:EFR1 family ferrodoxin [bacterium]|nr:EFR1 family ferrodoxin [bacterium]